MTAPAADRHRRRRGTAVHAYFLAALAAAFPRIQPFSTYFLWNQLANQIRTTAATSMPTIPVVPLDWAIFPITIPYQPKSASPNVVLAKPKAPSTLSKKAGRNVIRIPFTKPPQAAPQRPPVALPKTPAVPPRSEERRVGKECRRRG